MNLVTSIYGRKPTQYQRWVSIGLLRYVDDMRKNLPESVRLQLPSELEGSYKHKIISKSQLVNKPEVLFELTLSEETARAFGRLWNAGDTREVKRSIEGGKRTEFELTDRNEELHETEKRSSVQKMITDFYQLASNNEVSKFEKLVKNSDLRNRFPDVKRFEDFVVDVFTGVMNRKGSL